MTIRTLTTDITVRDGSCGSNRIPHKMVYTKSLMWQRKRLFSALSQYPVWLLLNRHKWPNLANLNVIKSQILTHLLKKIITWRHRTNSPHAHSSCRVNTIISRHRPPMESCHLTYYGRTRCPSSRLRAPSSEFRAWSECTLNWSHALYLLRDTESYRLSWA